MTFSVKKVTDTDRQTNSLTPHKGVCIFFLSIKFVTSLLALLAGVKTDGSVFEKIVKPVLYFHGVANFLPQREMKILGGKINLQTIVYFETFRKRERERERDDSGER